MNNDNDNDNCCGEHDPIEDLTRRVKQLEKTLERILSPRKDRMSPYDCSQSRKASLEEYLNRKGHLHGLKPHGPR